MSKDTRSNKVVLAFWGFVIGGILGYYAAHYFPLWGELAFLAEPKSPARSALVPGHSLLLAVGLGALGFARGYYLDRK